MHFYPVWNITDYHSRVLKKGKIFRRIQNLPRISRVMVKKTTEKRSTINSYLDEVGVENGWLLPQELRGREVVLDDRIGVEAGGDGWKFIEFSPICLFFWFFFWHIEPTLIKQLLLLMITCWGWNVTALFRVFGSIKYDRMWMTSPKKYFFNTIVKCNDYEFSSQPELLGLFDFSFINIFNTRSKNNCTTIARGNKRWGWNAIESFWKKKYE